MDLSQEFRNRREELGVTQEYLADLSGVGLRTIKSFESGKGNPRLETLTKLSEILGMELVWTIRQTGFKS
jgi:transcriptional regulator with XRE-family HTH domain